MTDNPRQPGATTLLGTRAFWAVLLMIVLVRGAVWWVVAQYPDRAMSPDSLQYLELSRHFPEAYLNGDAEYRAASVFRTPAYPLFCYTLFHVLGDGAVAVLLAQNLLSLTCVGLVFVLARRIAGRSAARWAAILAALDPLAITYSNYIRNEVLFTAILLLGVLQWHKSMSHPGPTLATSTGFLFGLATLVRPVTTYLILFLLPADLWLRRRHAAAVMMSVWLAVGFALPVGTWMVRNYRLVGDPVVSSVSGYNLLYYRVAGAIAEERDEQRAVVALRMQRAATMPSPGLSSANAPNEGHTSSAIAMLIEHPYGFIVSTCRGWIRLVFGPGTAALHQLLFGTVSKSLNAVSYLLAGYLIVVYLGLSAGVISLIRSRTESLMLIGTIVAYTVILSSGPEAYSRFRAPLMPLFAAVAGIGFASLERRLPHIS